MNAKMKEIESLKQSKNLKTSGSIFLKGNR